MRTEQPQVENIQAAEGLGKPRSLNRLLTWAPSRKAMALWVFAIFAIGATLRITLLFALGEMHIIARFEALSIAASLATTGSYANAYGQGSGPTAHCAPLLPLLMAALFHTFGVYTPAAVIAMHLAAASAATLAFALLPILAAVAGLPPACGVVAGLAGALLPFDFYYQVNPGAPLTSAVFVGLLIAVFWICMRHRFTKREGMLCGIAIGLGCLLNPAMIPPMLGCLIVCAIRYRRRLKRIFPFFLLVSLGFVATVTPWAIRNYEALGAPIWTRSNFWLEFNLSNNNLLTADEDRNFLLPGYALMHPTISPVERAKVKRLGEVAYNRTKRKQVLSWISTHKARFVKLTVERFRLFWIPRMKRLPQSVAEALLTILGLMGLVLLFRAKAPSGWIFCALVVLFPPVYYLIQATPRYRLPLEPFLFLLSGYCILRIAVNVERRWRQSLSA